MIGSLTDGRAAAPGNSALMAERLCQIKLTLGEPEPCPEGACPFWEHGGAVLESGCGLQRLRIDVARPELAEYLVQLRSQLEAARDENDRRAARQAFAALVPPELSGS